MLQPRFNINWFRFIQQLCPPWLRKPVLVSLLDVVASQVHSLYRQFTSWREQQLFIHQHTGQVISLEHLLNTVESFNGIHITDGHGEYDYIINVPIEFAINQDRMVAHLNRYRQAGKTYQIRRY